MYEADGLYDVRRKADGRLVAASLPGVGWCPIQDHTTDAEREVLRRMGEHYYPATVANALTEAALQAQVPEGLADLCDGYTEADEVADVVAAHEAALADVEEEHLAKVARDRGDAELDMIEAAEEGHR